MIESIIIEFLTNNRRLVLPGVGAFLKKEDDSIVFVPFLNKDDGVLNNLVRQVYGTSTDEASTIIEQYSEGVMAGLFRQGKYTVGNLGTLRRDINGVIFLDTSFNPALEPALSNVSDGNNPSPEKIGSPPPATPSSPIVPPKTSPVSGLPNKYEVESANRTVVNPVLRHSAPQSENSPSPEPHSAGPGTSPASPISNPPSPDSSVPGKSLTYGGSASTQTFTESTATSRPQPKRWSDTPNPGNPNNSTPITGKDHTDGRKKTDFVLIFAILIALLAIAAMIYAYMTVDIPGFTLG